MKNKKLSRLHKKTYKLDIKDHRDFIVTAEGDFPSFCSIQKYCPPVKSDTGIRSSMTHVVLSAVETTINVEMCELANYPRKRNSLIKEYMKDNTHNFFSESLLYSQVAKYEKNVSYREILEQMMKENKIGNTTFSVGQFCRIEGSGLSSKFQDRKKIINSMKYVLSKKIPIMGALKFPREMLNYTNGGIMKDNVKLDVEYAVLFVGYIDNFNNGEGYFIFQNSWGKRWGDKGYGYVSYRSMLTRRCSDMWIINRMTASTGISGYDFLDIQIGVKINMNEIECSSDSSVENLDVEDLENMKLEKKEYNDSEIIEI